MTSPDSSKPKLDKEEFQTWKTSRMTQEVLRRLQDQATQETRLLMEDVRNQLTFPPPDWAALQPQKAYRRGLCDGTIAVVNLEFEDVLTAEEAQELREKSNAADA